MAMSDCLAEAVRVSNDVKKWSKTLKSVIATTTSEELSKACLECAVELYRLIDKRKEERIDGYELARFFLSLSEHISLSNEKDYQRYAISVLNVLKYSNKKNVSLDLIDEIIALLFKNKMEMSPKFITIYWPMLSNKISYLERNIKDLKSEPLLKLSENTVAIIRVFDRLQFCKTYLSWTVQKCFRIFEDKYRRELIDYFDKLVVALLECKSEKIGEAEYAEIHKNNLFLITTIFPTIQQIQKYGILNSITRMYESIFVQHSNYKFSLSLCMSAISTLLNIKGKPRIDHKSIDGLKTSMESLIRRDLNTATELALSLRKILNEYIGNLKKQPKDFWTDFISPNVQKSLLELSSLICNVLKSSTKQNVKCINCKFQSGLHDACYLIPSLDTFIANSCKSNMDVSETIPLVLKMIRMQTDFIVELKIRGCPQWSSLWTHLQKHCHSEAVAVYSTKHNDHCKSLFDAYHTNCLRIWQLDRNAFDLTEFARGLYNKSICEADLNNYRTALSDCFLSAALQLYANPDEDITKYMKFAVQIKVRASNTDEDIQSINVRSSCIERMKQDNAYKVLADVDFARLLLIELEAYSTVWFSAQPVVSVCKTLQSNYRRLSSYRLICGMVASLLGIRSTKFHCPELIEFVRFTQAAFKSNVTGDLPNQFNDTFVKLIRGNVLNAQYECSLYEKMANEPVPDLLAQPRPQSPHRNLHPDDTCDIIPTQHSLTITVETEILAPLFEAVKLWNEVLLNRDKLDITNKTVKSYVDDTLEIMKNAFKMLAVRRLDVDALYVADITYEFASAVGNQSIVLQTIGFIIERVYSTNRRMLESIENANRIVKNILDNPDSSIIDYVFEYLLNLAIYYYNTEQKSNSLVIFNYVYSKIMNEYLIGMEPKKVESVCLSSNKLMVTLTQINDILKRPSLIADLANAQIECTEIIKTGRNSVKFYSSLLIWFESGLRTSKFSQKLGLSRRARAHLKSILPTVQRLFMPRATAEVLLLLANVDQSTEQFDDCTVKIEAIEYILTEQKNESNAHERLQVKTVAKSPQHSYKQQKQLEMVLDAPDSKYSDIGASPVFRPAPYMMPSFIDHRKTCACEKCKNLNYFTLIIDLNHLRAQRQFKTANTDTAESYFEGGLKLAKYLKFRIDYVVQNSFVAFKNIICDSIEEYRLYNEFVGAECELNINAGYFYITENDFEKAIALNEDTIRTILKFHPSDGLLSQCAYEQKLYFLQAKTFKLEETDTPEPEKTSSLTPQMHETVFKTPSNKTTIKLSTVKRRVVKSKFDENSEDIDQLYIKFNKLKFDDVDVPTPKPAKTSSQPPKTPAPKLSAFTPLKTPKTVKLFDSDGSAKRSERLKTRNTKTSQK